jgi:hypothetical protein
MPTSTNAKVVAPWRRNEATASSDNGTFGYMSKSSFSAQAPAFEPQFNSQATEFVPSFNPQSAVFVPNFNAQAAVFVPSFMIVGDTQPAPQPAPQPINKSGCCICLDDYSDYTDSDDDDSVSQAAVQSAAVAKEQQCNQGDANKPPQLANKFPATALDKNDGQETLLSMTLSTITISTQATSDVGGCTPTDASDLEPMSACEDDKTAQTPTSDIKEPLDEHSFTINGLLKLRHSVSLMDGIDDRLSALEVSPRSLPSEKAADIPAEKPKPRQIRKPDKAQREKTRSDRERSQADPGPAFAAVRAEATGPQKLKVSEDSWQVRQQNRRTSQEATEQGSMSDEEVVRTMKSILNKLTIEKFQRLSRQLIQCGIRTTSHLEILIFEVFEKATTQHHFIDMYADLCTALQSHFSEAPVNDNPKMNFKKVLLNACQASFEKHLAPPVHLDRLEDDEQLAAERRYKMRMLGNIRFVGALLTRKMLATKVMFAIIEELLGDPTPEALESLAALLNVVGPTFDFPEWPHRILLVAVFDRLRKIIKQADVKPRVCCLLQDVLDLRANGWEDRKPKKVEAPSTLAQVAKKREAEEAAVTPTPEAAYRNSWAARPMSNSFGNGSGKTSPSGAKNAGGNSNIRGLAADLFAPAPSESASPAKESVRPVLQLKKRQDTACEKPFDKEACRKEVSSTLSELRVSHDVKEAILRMAAVAVPLSQQPEELCTALTMIAEEGSQEVRKIGFQFVAGLFMDGHWQPGALSKGIQTFKEETCTDLKLDIPSLPNIVREELQPAFKPLLEKGLLQSSSYSLLMADF